MWQPLPASAVRTPFPRAALSFEILTFRISSNWKTIPGLGMERPGRSSRIPSGPWCCASVQGVLHRSFLSTCFVEVATSRRSEAKCQCTECEYVCLCVHAHACMCVCVLALCLTVRKAPLQSLFKPFRACGRGGLGMMERGSVLRS